MTRFNFKLFVFIFVFSILPSCFWASASRNINELETENPICIDVSDDGLVVIYDHLSQIAFIAPEVFDKNNQFHPFEKSDLSAQAHWIVRLSGDEKILLKSNVDLLDSSLHVNYELTPENSVEMGLVQTGISFQYDDWAGCSYRLGTREGIVPQAPISDNNLIYSNSDFLSLGPSKVLDGLNALLVVNGLYTDIWNIRKRSGFLKVYLTHGEDWGRPWKWDRGETKHFDFQVTFNNRKMVLLSDLLAKLKPNKPTLKPNELTPEQMAWGENQLKRMLRDRPAMVPYVKKGDDLWNWMVRQFAGEYVGGGIWWDARSPEPLWNSFFYGAGNGKKAHIQVTDKFYEGWKYNWGKPKTAPNLWFGAFYEIFNIIYDGLDEKLDVQAIEGKIDRQHYILSKMLIENITDETALEFFHKVWVPHCLKYHLPYEDEYLTYDYGKEMMGLPDIEVFKREFRPDDFHYKFFSNEYDRITKK
jgi:hypothetical protein